jgi:pimeloyl-ACP methyl ester carboxylesterase
MTTAAPQPALPRYVPWLQGGYWLRLTLATGVSALAGLLVAVVMPRGPATTAQALAAMAIGLGVGLVAGLALRSRWALLLAPMAHVAAIELTRLPVAGPTVDAIRLDTAFGVLALLLGRGFHGLVGLLPMLLGASLGAAIARRRAGQPRSRRGGARLRRAVVALSALGLVALAALIAMPASTPPILGADGQPVPGSIAELTAVRLGGVEQAILIRAHSPDRPVLLYLSGGPGQSDLGWSRVYFGELTRDFVVVGWDQRGAGKSYAALDPTSSWTLEQAVSDTVELTNYLRARFGEEKIYLMGESWGTVLGVLAVQRHPELYHAWVGSGQMVSPHETDRRLYHDLLAYAERTGDTALASRMQAYGEPPYADVYAYGVVMGYYDALYRPYTPPRAYLERGQAAGMGPLRNMASEYTLVEKLNVVRGLLDMFSVLYAQLAGVDFRRDVRRLEVPVYVLDGEAELAARRELMLEWYEQLEVPVKRRYRFADAAHAVAFEEFEALGRILTEDVLPATYPTH